MNLLYKVLHGGESIADLQTLEILTALNCPVALLAKHQKSFKKETDSELSPLRKVFIQNWETPVFFVQGNLLFASTSMV